MKIVGNGRLFIFVGQLILIGLRFYLRVHI